jgi:hypothetical protein
VAPPFRKLRRLVAAVQDCSALLLDSFFFMIFLLWAFIPSETGHEKRPQAMDFAVHWATSSWSFTGTVRD